MPTIVAEWLHGPVSGHVEVLNGRLAGLKVCRGKGQVQAASFSLEPFARLEIAVADERMSVAADPTRITFRTDAPFSVLLRDVSRECPVWVSECRAVVTTSDDERTGAAIVEAISAHGWQTTLQAMAGAPEESFATASANTRALHAPLWLGISRDMRLFEVTHGYDAPNIDILPRYHGDFVRLPEALAKDYTNWPLVPNRISIHFGRGMGCVRDYTRRLEDGVLPILHAQLRDDQVTYHITAFASLERSPLTAATLRGTHYLIADAHAGGQHMFGETQQEEYATKLVEEIERDEETVLYWRIEAVNTGVVPRYAWLKMPIVPSAAGWLDTGNGLARFKSSGRVYTTAMLNGAPLPKPEIAILLKPAERAVVDFFIPHRPLTVARGRALAAQDFTQRHAECRAFWQAKLATAARYRIPEPRVDEMARAGLLHLDLISYGLEPDKPVAATVGVYSAIGSESAPIIQFMDAMGWHALAERAIAHFLEKQRPDGFMQNFFGYMSETGPVLWTMGEHFRYTRDMQWARQVAPNVRRACRYLIAWRQRNQREEFRLTGYGMIDGRVADPKEYYRVFCLNADTYIGLRRAAEMLAAIGDPEAVDIDREAAGLKADIIAALKENLASSPVVPLGDGSWCRTTAPQAEARGPLALQLTDAGAYTHGCFTIRDGWPLALASDEVLAPDDPLTDILLRYQVELFNIRNVGLSQPYSGHHPLIHLLRGEVKAFLMSYYNTFAGLADRETYTFWEHFYFSSPHKTREEACFLMQTRWMLYLERGQTLHLLPGIPRAWLAAGQHLAIERAASYFGPFSLNVDSDVAHGRITARIECATDRRPADVILRLPHPGGLKAARVNGGAYDAVTETVRIAPFSGCAEVVAEYAG